MQGSQGDVEYGRRRINATLNGLSEGANAVPRRGSRRAHRSPRVEGRTCVRLRPIPRVVRSWPQDVCVVERSRRSKQNSGRDHAQRATVYGLSAMVILT